ncbi:DMT family transporter [uncultured Turicimonas sp.]|uniref:DMT family transporter n=1 Tax=uncultured Turicimonas sp. TaxID=1918607 RepID=UPI002803BDF6|nr:DMT family transporter [uncultured Turicimonas sp.]
MNKNSFWLLAAAFFTSCVTVTTRLTGGQYQFFEIMVGKYLFISLITGFLLIYRKESFFPHNPKLLMLRCLFGVGSAVANTILILNVPAALSQAVNYTSSVWIVLILSLITVSFSTKSFVGSFVPVIIGLAGIFIIFNPNLDKFSDVSIGIAVAYGLSSALASIFLRELGKHNESPLLVTFYFGISCLLLGAGFCAACNSQNLGLIFSDPLLYLIVIFALLYQITRTIGWEFGNPFINSCLLFTGVPFVIALGYLFLQELPGLTELIGICLIVVSALLSFRFQRRKSHSFE